ncbi:MAG: hypothetical protein GY724_26805 [Actinomycetia bacterium]|nr:hypothetical protein [Actinomycetes bacterium]
MIGLPNDPATLPPVFPPDRGFPRPSVPVVVPMVDLAGQQAHGWLAEQRRILLSGPLDSETVTTLAAQLMTLDGCSSDGVELVVNSHGGPMAEIFAVLDVIDLMRAPVNVTCIGTAAGTAAALVACGTGERRAARRASFSLRYDELESIEGRTHELVGQVEQLATLRTRYLELLVAATDRDKATLTEELDRGQPHTAAEALAMGLIDSIASGPGTP